MVFLAAPEGVLHAVGRAAEDDPRHAPAPGPPNPLAPDPDPDLALILALTPDLAPGIPPQKKNLLIFKPFFPATQSCWTHFWLSPVGAGVTPDPGPEVAPAPDLAPSHDLQTSIVTLQNHAVQRHRKSRYFCYTNPVRIWKADFCFVICICIFTRVYLE